LRADRYRLEMPLLHRVDSLFIQPEAERRRHRQIPRESILTDLAAQHHGPFQPSHTSFFGVFGFGPLNGLAGGDAVRRQFAFQVLTLRLLILVDRPIVLATDLEDLAQPDVCPQLSPHRFQVAIQRFAELIRGRLIVALLEIRFGETIATAL
jgi:hypothetical protein